MDSRFHVSVKAAIIRDRQILLVEYQDRPNGETGWHYNFPGGRLRANERMPAGVRRKVMEEAGATVEVGPLLLVYEYIGLNHDCLLGDKHSVSLLFHCNIVSGSPEPSMARCTHPDEIQTDVKWIPLDSLGDITLWPNITRQLLDALGGPNGLEDLYIGDVL